jgi:hypothetical protein
MFCLLAQYALAGIGAFLALIGGSLIFDAIARRMRQDERGGRDAL